SRILTRFHFGLNDDGFLLLGRAEMLLTHANLFRAVDLKNRVFAKIPTPVAREPLLLPAHRAAVEANRRKEDCGLREAIVEATPVAQLIVDRSGTLLLANALSRALFSLSARDTGRAFEELDIAHRPLELRPLIDEAFTKRRPTTVAKVERNESDGTIRYLDVQVMPLVESDGLPLAVQISYTDVTHESTLRDELQKTHSELETAYEELQSTNEELETTNEELQSTVEELETTNEELQSSNEELETMNEELQSSNEELQTLNDELKLRTEDLNESNDFLESILGSMEAAVVVIDEHEAVQIWSRKAEQLWGMRADEAVKQLFFGFDIGLPMAEVRSLIHRCSETQTPQQLTVAATNRRG